MPAPTNVLSLQSFLGLASYDSNYIPNMHTRRAPLNKHFKKDKVELVGQLSKIFNNLKTALMPDLTNTLQP